MRYPPDSVLLDNIYIPFYIPSTKVSISLVDVALELDARNEPTIINLGSNLPFIDPRLFDPASRDWLWQDSYGYKFRESGTSNVWTFIPEVQRGTAQPTYSFTPSNQTYDQYAKYGLGITNIGTYSNTTKTFYRMNPLVITVDEVLLEDITVYDSAENVFDLTVRNRESNREFYYNPVTNRIYTNQNLDAIIPTSMKISYYKNPDSLSVKCRLASNSNNEAYYTPTVDYYVFKLCGQYLKGQK